jgi:hypothetical protein
MISFLHFSRIKLCMHFLTPVCVPHAPSTLHFIPIITSGKNLNHEAPYYDIFFSHLLSFHFCAQIFSSECCSQTLLCNSSHRMRHKVLHHMNQQVKLLLMFHNCSTLTNHSPMRCATALIKKHIVIPSVQGLIHACGTWRCAKLHKSCNN